MKAYPWLRRTGLTLGSLKDRKVTRKLVFKSKKAPKASITLSINEADESFSKGLCEGSRGGETI